MPTCGTYVLSSAETFAIQEESAFGTIIGTPGNSNCCRVTPGERFVAERPINNRPDKNPTLSQTVGNLGRRNATWNVGMSMAGNGSAGVAPDSSLLLKAAFGKAPTVVASTSVTYGVDDNVYFLDLYSYYQPDAAAYNRCAFGSIVDEATFEFGGDFGLMNFRGPAYWVIDAAQIADGATPSEAKGGLSSFPARPSAPVLNGSAATGYEGSITIDGDTYGDIVGGTISCKFNRSLPPAFNNSFPGCPQAGTRQITISNFRMLLAQSADLAALLVKVNAGTPVPVVITIGSTAGNRWEFTMGTVKLPVPRSDDSGQRVALDFSGATCYASTSTAKDEISLRIY